MYFKLRGLRSAASVLGAAAAIAVLGACSGAPSSSPIVPKQLAQNSASQALELSRQLDSLGPVDSLDDAIKCHGQNLIQDGSFETPALPAGQGQYFKVGTTLGPWTVTGPPSDSVALVTSTLMDGGYTFNAQSGVQSVDLTVLPNGPAGLAQTVNLQKSHRYSLCFWVGNVNNPGGVLGRKSTDIVEVNGHRIFTARNSLGTPNSGVVAWKKFRTTVVGDGGPMTISFNNGDRARDNYNGLDSIELVP